MREITTHRVEGKGGGKDTTRILVRDEPGQGGACHWYTVDNPASQEVIDEAAAQGQEVAWPDLLSIHFQNGPIQEVGVNGVQQEHLLAVVEDRLACFQAGPFANRYNAKALEYVQMALEMLHRRTTDRLARGVEGMNVQ